MLWDSTPEEMGSLAVFIFRDLQAPTERLLGSGQRSGLGHRLESLWCVSILAVPRQAWHHRASSALLLLPLASLHYQPPSAGQRLPCGCSQVLTHNGHVCVCFGFVWQDFGSGGAAGAVSGSFCEESPGAAPRQVRAGSVCLQQRLAAGQSQASERRWWHLCGDVSRNRQETLCHSCVREE